MRGEQELGSGDKDPKLSFLSIFGNIQKFPYNFEINIAISIIFCYVE